MNAPNPFGQQGQPQPGFQPPAAQQGFQPQPGQSPFGQPQAQPAPQQSPFGGGQQGFQQPAQTPPPAQQGFQPQPQAQQPQQGFGQQPQTGGVGGADPFGAVPDAPPPGMGGLGRSDAEAGSVIIMRVNSVEHGVPSKFPDPKTGGPRTQSRLHVDAIVVTGPQQGAVFSDLWLSWASVSAQFGPCAGNGVPYLVQLGTEGNSVTASEVTDPQIRQYAATLI